MEPVCRRLSALAPLTQDEVRLLSGLEARQKEHGPGEILLTEGKVTPGPSFVISGWACHQRILPDGRRQIFGFVLPGDVVGAWSVPRALALATMVALTPLTTVDVPDLEHVALRPASRSNFAKAMALAAHQNEIFLLDHVMRLGCLTAQERMAHLLLELRHRLAVVGLADGRRFPMPLTQEVLADVLGLSVVHVNRTLQQLRRERLIEVSGGEVVLLNPELLTAVAEGTVAQPFTT
jgi:CRP-like cAMP-binding protein